MLETHRRRLCPILPTRNFPNPVVSQRWKTFFNIGDEELVCTVVSRPNHNSNLIYKGWNICMKIHNIWSFPNPSKTNDFCHRKFCWVLKLSTWINFFCRPTWDILRKNIPIDWPYFTLNTLRKLSALFFLRVFSMNFPWKEKFHSTFLRNYLSPSVHKSICT